MTPRDPDMTPRDSEVKPHGSDVKPRDPDAVPLGAADLDTPSSDPSPAVPPGVGLPAVDAPGVATSPADADVPRNEDDAWVAADRDAPPRPPQFDGPEFHTDADGQVWYTPGHFKSKLAFLFASLAVVAVGLWMVWDPARALLLGERGVGRVVRIEREEPGAPPEVIRYRRPIAAGTEATRFDYYVAVERPGGERREFRLAVGSRREPYEVAAGTAANVNEQFDVIYDPAGTVAYGLFHHRTWAFGAGFLFTGGLLTLCAVPTVLAVNKPIAVDP